MVARWIITHVIADLSSSSESNPKAANGYCFNTHISLGFHLQTSIIMSELRQRPTATASASNPDPDTPPRTQPSHNEADDLHGVTVLDIIRVLATFVLATLGLSYYMTNSESFLFGYRPWYTRWPVVKAYLVSSHAQQTPVRANHLLFPHLARPRHTLPIPIMPLQRHRRLAPPLPRRQRLRLRRLRQPRHLRPGRELQFLRGARCDARVCDWLLSRGPDAGFGRR